MAKSTEMEDLDDSAKASLGHSSGALARSATRRNKYGASASLLIYLGATPREVRLEKDEEDIDLTVRICQIWRQLPKTEANRNQLLVCDQPRSDAEVTKIVVNRDVELTGSRLQ